MTAGSPVVLAFSAHQTSRLTGLSPAQLRYWDETGFFRPEYASGEKGRAYDRIYSFRNVVGLRTLSLLRNTHGLSLQHLRDVARRLEAYTAHPWSEVRLWIEREVSAMNSRRDDQIGKMEQHRYVAHNSKVLSGTRIPVATIRRFLEDGYSTAEILDEYPSLTEADVLAIKGSIAA